MIPLNLDLLSKAELDRSLDGLESAVWSAVAEREVAEHRMQRLAMMQCAILAVAVMGSAAAGGVVTSRALADTPELGVFSPHAALAPSSRLVGSH